MYCFFLSYYLLFVVFVENGQKKIKSYYLFICLICRKWGNPATNKKDPAEAGSGSHVSNCEPLALDQKDGGVTLVFH